MSLADVTSLDATMRDVYPLPGERIKQWVVDMRREHEWERATCPRLEVPHHLNSNDETCYELEECASVGLTSWNDIHGSDCRFCDGFAQGALGRPEMVAWFAEKAARPPGCSDRSQLSDEVQPDLAPLGDSPLFKFITRSK